MNIEDLHEDFIEAVKQISENRNKLTESKRNELTSQLIEREKFQVYNYNCELSGYNRRLKRACSNALSFFENYRLSHLHEMNDKEIKLSHMYLQEMQDVLDEEESFIKYHG